MRVTPHVEFMDLLHGAKEEGHFDLWLFSALDGVLDEGLIPHVPSAQIAEVSTGVSTSLVLRMGAPTSLMLPRGAPTSSGPEPHSLSISTCISSGVRDAVIKSSDTPLCPI